MRDKLIFITGVLALGLSACGAQGSDPAGESSAEAVASTEFVTTEETASAEMTAATEISGEGETQEIHWEDYGTCTPVVKEFTNDRREKTYYYQIDEFYFFDEKYAKVNEYLQKMYQKYTEQYEDYATQYTGEYELVDASLPEAQRYDDNYLVFNYITFVDDNYVSLQFNDTLYFAGAAHPETYFAPVTISVETGEEVTPEEILGKTWEEIREAGGIEEENEEDFNTDYGFYLTDTELCYLYRLNYYVEEIKIPR